MATCIQTQTIYAFATSSTSAKTGYQVQVLDSATPIASCGQLAISSVEYQDLQHGYITSREDADAIAGSLALLIGIAFTFKALKKQLDVDPVASDEKH